MTVYTYTVEVHVPEERGRIYGNVHAYVMSEAGDIGNAEAPELTAKLALDLGEIILNDVREDLAKERQR